MDCPKCGAQNASGSRYCVVCGASLAAASVPPERPVLSEPTSVPASARPYSRPADLEQRPGCVPAYGGLIALPAALLLWLGINVLRGGGVPGVQSFFDFSVLTTSGWVFLLVGLAYLVSAGGLVTWQNWARWAIIVLDSLGLAGIAYLCIRYPVLQMLIAYEGAPILIGIVVGFLVNLGIVVWFVTHRDAFK